MDESVRLPKLDRERVVMLADPGDRFVIVDALQVESPSDEVERIEEIETVMCHVRFRGTV